MQVYNILWKVAEYQENKLTLFERTVFDIVYYAYYWHLINYHKVSIESARKVLRRVMVGMPNSEIEANVELLTLLIEFENKSKLFPNISRQLLFEFVDLEMASTKSDSDNVEPVNDDDDFNETFEIVYDKHGR